MPWQAARAGYAMLRDKVAYLTAASRAHGSEARAQLPVATQHLLCVPALAPPAKSCPFLSAGHTQRHCSGKPLLIFSTPALASCPAVVVGRSDLPRGQHLGLHVRHGFGGC